MFVWTTILLLQYFLFSLCVEADPTAIVIAQTDKNCSPGVECETRATCPYVQEKYQQVQDLDRSHEKRRDVIQELKAAICNRRKRAFCCPKTDNTISIGGNLSFIGDFPELSPGTHPMSGQVYTKGDSTIVIKNFLFPLPGPDAFFWAGSLGSPYPSPDAAPGHPIAFPNPTGRTWSYDDDIPVIPAWDGVKDIELELPAGVTVDNISWLAVWCRTYKHNFGHVLFNNPAGNQQQNIPTKFYGGGRAPSMYKSFEQIGIGNIKVTDN